MYKEWRPTTKYIVAVGLLIFGLFVLYLSRSVITLLLFAALIAFLVRPIINFLDRRLRFPHGVAVLVTYIIVALVLLLAPLVLIPSVVNGVNYLLQIDYEAMIGNLSDWSQAMLLGLKDTGVEFLGFKIVIDSLIDPILLATENAGTVVTPEIPSISTLINSVGQAFALSYGVAVGLVGTVVSGVISFAFLIISSIYFNLDAHRFRKDFMNLVPQAYKSEMVKLFDQMEIVWESFFRGQVTLMLLIGFVVWLGGSILGLPGAVVLGIIAGVLEVIPNVGSTIAAVPAVIVALIQGSEHLPVSNIVFALIVIAFYVLVNFFENTIVLPRVMGEAVKIHPLVVFMGVLVGASVWGIWGALLAAPVIASTRVIVKYLYLRVLGEEPFPVEEFDDEKVLPITEKSDVEEGIDEEEPALPADKEVEAPQELKVEIENSN
jgi:predicted PurR-regulated permease PerM